MLLLCYYDDTIVLTEMSCYLATPPYYSYYSLLTTATATTATCRLLRVLVLVLATWALLVVAVVFFVTTPIALGRLFLMDLCMVPARHMHEPIRLVTLHT